MDKIEFATTVILVGLTIVFLALIGLTLFFMLCGKIFSIKKDKNDKTTPPKATPNGTASAPAPNVQQGIGDDVIAAISAAVAYMMGDSGIGYTVRSIKRASQPRKEWRLAGMMQNTRPF